MNTNNNKTNKEQVVELQNAFNETLRKGKAFFKITAITFFVVVGIGIVLCNVGHGQLGGWMIAGICCLAFFVVFFSSMNYEDNQSARRNKIIDLNSEDAIVERLASSNASVQQLIGALGAFDGSTIGSNADHVEEFLNQLIYDGKVEAINNDATPLYGLPSNVAKAA